MEENFYEKMAKKGWLGTRAQVSAQYGHPAWKTEDSNAQAIKRVMNKSVSTKKPDESST